MIKVLDELGYEQLLKQYESEEKIETKSEKPEKEEIKKEEVITDEKFIKGMENFINKIKENNNNDIKVIFDLGNKVFKDKILNDTALKENIDSAKELLDKILKKEKR